MIDEKTSRSSGSSPAETKAQQILVDWPPPSLDQSAPQPIGWLSGRRKRLRRWISITTAAVNRLLDKLPPGRWMHRAVQRKLEFTDVQVPLERGGPGIDGFRIAFISDIHAGSYMNQQDLCRLFLRVNALEPDLVVLGGDLINTRECEIMMYREAVPLLKPRYGIYAVPGNHDHFWGEELGVWTPLLQEFGVRVLNNRGVRIEHEGSTFWLAGVDDLTEGRPNLIQALHGSQAGEPVVLATHHPDFFFEAAAVGVDLVLAGHTHGGQIAPFGKTPISHSHFGYVRGKYDEVDSMLYVGRGAGLTLLPIRIGAPAEVPIITLRTESCESPKSKLSTPTPGGEPTRIVTGGLPEVPGDTMAAKRAWLRDNADWTRTGLVLEPRGHDAIVLAYLLPACDAAADIGVVFANDAGYLGMCGHGTIGVVSALIETGRIPVVEPETKVVLDTPVGLVHATAHVEDGRPVAVTMRNVVSFLFKRDVEVSLAGVGTLHVDLAYGGNWFGMVPQEEIGLAIEMGNLHELMSIATRVRNALIEQGVRGFDPETGEEQIVDHIEIIGTRQVESGLGARTLTLCPGTAYDRSPCGTGTSAKLAALHARGKIRIGENLYNQSVTGTEFIGTVLAEAAVGDHQGIVPQVRGSAFLTGEQRFRFDPHDPLRFGITQ